MIAICDCFCSPEGVKVKFFIIFKVLSVAENCVRPESVSLSYSEWMSFTSFSYSKFFILFPRKFCHSTWIRGMIPCDETEASCTLSKVGKIAETVEKKQRLIIFKMLKNGTQHLLSDLFFYRNILTFFKNSKHLGVQG